MWEGSPSDEAPRSRGCSAHTARLWELGRSGVVGLAPPAERER
eukprot:gene28462-55047_t